MPQRKSGLPHPHSQRVAPQAPRASTCTVSPGTKPISSKRSKVLCSRPSRAGTSPVTSAGVRTFSPSRPEAADGDAEATANVAASALGYRAAALSCMVFMGNSLFANEFGSHFTNGVPPSIDSNQSASERQSAAIKRRSWGLSTYSQSFLSCTSVLPGTPCPKGWREISKKPCTDSEDQGRAWNHLAAPRQGIAPCRILNSGCCQSVGKIKRP